MIGLRVTIRGAGDLINQMSMKREDRVYGEIVFDEPILMELIESPTLQRLQGVDMGGYYEVYFPGSKHSRFEHSLGVAWLLGRFGASLEE